MYLIYMDESGNTGTKVDPDQPIHLIGTIIVEDEKIRPFEDKLSEIAQAHFPAVSKNRRFEFHGAEMYSGSGFFRGIKPSDRIAAVKAIIEAAKEFCSAFGYAGINKAKSAASDHPHQIAFTLLIERLEGWLAARDSLGLIVADENREMAQRVIDDFAWSKEIATSWGYQSVQITRVVDTIHFVQSRNNRIIQACDVLTHFWLKGHRLSERLIEKYMSEKPSEAFPQWIANTRPPTEQATWDLYREVGKITCWRAKIWPA